MSVFADAVTGGYIAGNIIFGLTALVCLPFIAYGFYRGFKGDSYSSGDGFVYGGAALLVLVISAGVYVWSTWPFAYEYHHWIDKTVVAEGAASSRILTDSDGNIGQKFVIRSGGSYYGINDTRGALVKEGDTVRLRCKKAYDFGVPRSSHGWDCKWNGVTA